MLSRHFADDVDSALVQLQSPCITKPHTFGRNHANDVKKRKIALDSRERLLEKVLHYDRMSELNTKLNGMPFGYFEEGAKSRGMNSKLCNRNVLRDIPGKDVKFNVISKVYPKFIELSVEHPKNYRNVSRSVGRFLDVLRRLCAVWVDSSSLISFDSI